MKIVAMLPVKNEAWALRNCLGSLSFCDEILAVNDESVDDTKAILEEFDCTILPYNTNTNTGWKEYEIRSFLLSEARSRGATHLVAIDGDEMFSGQFVRDAKALLETLELGQTLSLPWPNIASMESVYQSIQTKPFIMRDDGVSTFKETFMHVPRVPSYSPGKVLAMPYATLHFQYLNPIRNTYKRTWYMMSELLKGNRHPMRINAMYRPITLERVPFDVGALTQELLPNPRTDHSIWQKDQVEHLLEQHGFVFFEPLDIWRIPELHDQFVKQVHREPRPIIAPQWLLVVNDLKNKVRNMIREHLL